MSFKLIAIRPLKGCNPNLLKNLKEEKIYKFCNNYTFICDSENKEEIAKIKVEDSTVPEGLYNSGNIKVNVSAIVGKNGSGKSAIVELFIAMIVKLSLIINRDFINAEEIYEDEEDKEENIAKFKESIEKDLDLLHVELYYFSECSILYREENTQILKIDIIDKEIIRKIKLEGNTFSITDYIKKSTNDSSEKKESKTYITVSDKEIKESNIDEILKDLFYSMVVNYSQYGFNTNELGEWINGIFHKNDGYQLPVVITPYRKKGNININTEIDLTLSRFLVNILQEKKLRKISENKPELRYIQIKLDNKKFIYTKDNQLVSRISNSKEEKKSILNLLIKKFYSEEEQSRIQLNEKNHFDEYALEYILIKLQKITNYSLYKKYKTCFFPEEIKDENVYTQYKIILEGNLLNEYFDNLGNDSSHNTYKLRQAINFLVLNYIKNIKDDELIPLDTLYLEINKSFKQLKKDGSSTDSEFGVSESLPSFFKITFLFDKDGTNNFSKLSSGEKQKIFSIHSILYHLRNLISVNKKDYVEEGKPKKIIRYNNINIIFDEIELYFHPEFQKAFINDLLRSLSVLKKTSLVNLNILFLTHSPFILSDIPKENILFLKDGKPKDCKDMNTFGANISDLLVNSFFMKTGLMGDFAKKRIEDTIDWLNKIWEEKLKLKRFKKDNKFEELSGEKEYHKKLINLIDEPIIKSKLNDMYSEVFGNEEEIKYLELEKKKLEAEIRRLKKARK